MWVSFLSTGTRYLKTGYCIASSLSSHISENYWPSSPYLVHVIFQGIGYMHGKTWLLYRNKKSIIFRDMRTQGEHVTKVRFWISCPSAEKTDSQIDQLKISDLRRVHIHDELELNSFGVESYKYRRDNCFICIKTGLKR